MSRQTFALSLCAAVAAGLLTLSPNPAAAGGLEVGVSVSVHGGRHHHHAHRLPVPVPHGAYAYRGPALYYSYHYDHIPAYPVPIFPTHQPVVVLHQTAVRAVAPVSHVDWCHARYRSYRAYDNSFQPYHGPRRQCRSPFG